MQDLLAQPDEADEGEEGEGDHGAALQDVRQDVLRAEHVDGEGEDGGDGAGEEGPVDPAGGERHHAQPGHGHQRVVQPELDGPAHGAQQAREHQPQRDPLRHVGRVDRREGEAVVAELAELLLAVPEPLDEALLVDELDRAGADAGVEERAVRRALAPAHPADVIVAGRLHHLLHGGGGGGAPDTRHQALDFTSHQSPVTGLPTPATSPWWPFTAL